MKSFPNFWNKEKLVRDLFVLRSLPLSRNYFFRKISSNSKKKNNILDTYGAWKLFFSVQNPLHFTSSKCTFLDNFYLLLNGIGYKFFTMAFLPSPPLKFMTPQFGFSLKCRTLYTGSDIPEKWWDAETLYMYTSNEALNL